MIELISGPDPATVIRDRNPTTEEEAALAAVGGKWFEYSPKHGLDSCEPDPTWSEAGKPRPGIIWRAVDSTGEPIALTTGDEK